MPKPISPMRRICWKMRRERLLRENADKTSWQAWFGPEPYWPMPDPMEDPVRFMILAVYQKASRETNEELLSLLEKHGCLKITFPTLENR